MNCGLPINQSSKPTKTEPSANQAEVCDGWKWIQNIPNLADRVECESALIQTEPIRSKLEKIT